MVTAVERMRQDVARHMSDRVLIIREDSTPEDWSIDDATGEIIGTDPVEVWEGPATIAAPFDRGASNLDTIQVKIPALIEDLRRGDRVRVVQSADYSLIIGTEWDVTDIDYGTHRVTRTLVCARRSRSPEIPLREQA